MENDFPAQLLSIVSLTLLWPCVLMYPIVEHVQFDPWTRNGSPMIAMGLGLWINRNANHSCHMWYQAEAI